MSLNIDIDVGGYTGNAGTNAISIGWQPALVITMAMYGGSPGNRGGNLKIAGMSDDDYIEQTTVASYETANGNTLGSDGFSLGSDASHNGSGNAYDYLAVRQGPHTDTGSYTGGGGSQTITTGRQPVAVIIAQTDGTVRTFWKWAQSGATCLEFQTAISSVSAVTIISTGFTVEGNADDDTQNFIWVALYNDETIRWNADSYPGNSSTQTITQQGQPNILIILDATGGEICYVVTSVTAGDAGLLAGNWSLGETDYPTLVSTGFSLAAANLNTTGNTYYYLAGFQ